MYPADQLGIGYTEDDLPDTIEAISGDGLIGEPRPRGTFTRNGSGYEGTYDGAPFTYQIIDTSWQSLCNCLFYCSDNDFTDEFPDELNREGAIGPAERVSLCQWCLESDEVNVGGFTVIYFDGQATTDCNGRFLNSLTPHKWYLVPVGDFILQKTGNQNTPIGTYEYIDFPGSYKEIT
jgi:hypothetical protein